MKIKFSKRFVSLLLAVLIMIIGIPFDQMGVVWANDLGDPWDGVSVQKPETPSEKQTKVLQVEVHRGTCR